MIQRAFQEKSTDKYVLMKMSGNFSW